MILEVDGFATTGLRIPNKPCTPYRSTGFSVEETIYSPLHPRSKELALGVRGKGGGKP